MKTIFKAAAIAATLCVAAADGAGAAQTKIGTFSVPSGYSITGWSDDAFITTSKCPSADINYAPLVLYFLGNEGTLADPDLTAAGNATLRGQVENLGKRLGKLCVRMITVVGNTRYLIGVSSSATPEGRLSFGAQNVHDAIAKILDFYKGKRADKTAPQFAYLGGSAGALFGAKLIDKYPVTDPVLANMARALLVAGPAGGNVYESCTQAQQGSLVRQVAPSLFNKRCDGVTQPANSNHLTTPWANEEIVSTATKNVAFFVNPTNFVSFITAGKQIDIAAGTADAIFGWSSGSTVWTGPQYIAAFLKSVNQTTTSCPTPAYNAALGSEGCSFFPISGATHDNIWDQTNPNFMFGLCQLIAYSRYPNPYFTQTDRDTMCTLP